jgi:hypothetical protein
MDSSLRLENRRTGETIRMRRERGPSGQVILIVEGSLPAASAGPPAHVHFQEREEVQVRAGTVGARIGEQTVVLQTGGEAVFPAGTVHSWWNAGDGLLELRGRVFPAGDLDRFLQALFAVLNAGDSGRPSIFYLAHVLWRHRRTQRILKPPVAIQQILFPVVLLVGRILGKYSGAAWPGCPESCTGAPMVDSATSST